MGIPTTSVEISDGATEWYEKTGKHYFGQDFEWTPPVQKPILQAGINVADYDTILMVESLEHIPAEAFDPVMEDIMNNFHGYFVVVNWKDYHPIAIGQFASAAEHCRLVDDALYDSWAARAKRTVYRDGAHLVLEF
jgi:hypothetical protein